MRWNGVRKNIFHILFQLQLFFLYASRSILLCEQIKKISRESQMSISLVTVNYCWNKLKKKQIKEFNKFAKLSRYNK